MTHRGTTDKRLKEFGERFTRLIEQSKYKDWSDADIGKIFSVSYQSVGNWRKGTKFPGCENVIAIAEHFKVTTDWLLLGRGDAKSSGRVKGEYYSISSWPESAKGVVRGFADLYGSPGTEAR